MDGAHPDAAASAPTASNLRLKFARAIAKISDEKRKEKSLGKLASFADVVQAVAAFDKDGHIHLDFDDDDDEYDISGLQQHGEQVQAIEASLRGDAAATEHVPSMTICIMIVGTRGDVQPFIGIAKRLQQDGHRVRLATHAVYRDFVTEHGVEFYPLGGDPKELAAYMVKTGGHLIPLKYETITKDVPRNMQMIDEILNSTWPAVSAADPDGLGKGVPGKPFQAQAIISNPVTYGHIHVAERLGVPLHIMFPQPWVPTVAFPHPLSNMPYDDKPQKRNYMSYKLVDLLMWQGTEGLVNQFRTQVLGLRKIRKGDGGRDMLLDLAIPHAFMWSPALVPKPDDWGNIYDVIGTVLLKEAGSTYAPTPELEAFLGTDGGPIFVGFGSMVIADPKATTTMIIEAARLANVRVLIQSSWSDMAAGIDVPDNIFFLGNCPHDWLMPRVSAVVHHGGAGTTAAGLLAGKPTFIVPFFGDQPFWGRAVVRAGVGVEPCPIAELSVEKLHKAFVGLQTPEIRARALALCDVMASEDGVGEAVKCFYRHLPLKVMRCEVCEKNLATLWSEKDKIRLCVECEYVITSRPENSAESISEYQCVDYRARGPDSTLEGVASGAGALLHELGSGVKDVFIKPAQGYREQGATGAVIGLTKGVVSGLFIRPIQGVAIFADHVATGVYNKNRDADERKRSSVWLENTRLGEAVGYNTSTAHTASMNPDERLLDKKKNDNAHVAIQLSAEERLSLTVKFQQIMATRESMNSHDESFHVITSGARESVSSTTSDASTLSVVSSVSTVGDSKSVPKMNICLLTTGTWEDSIQQFVAIGLRLQQDGHRVRIATNENFRNRVKNAGLEYYPLGGHASTVSKYLSHQYANQNQKRSFFSKFKGDDEFPESEDLKAFVFSLWPACVEVDPKSPGLPFRADTIISHPLVLGQTIVAERLGVPLHCVSPTPLSRTEAFPHVLSNHPNLQYPYQYSPENASTFEAIDALLCKGMQDTLNSFRSSLGLFGAASRPSLLSDWRIPHSYLWNPSLLPKPSDWGTEIHVAGFVKLPEQQVQPLAVDAQTIRSFVAEASTPVIYFGFDRGDWDPIRVAQLVEQIEVAGVAAYVRIIFQVVGENESDELHRSKTVLEVDASTPAALMASCVAGAVHWGDASVVATWFGAGVPSCVVARNAMQRFWGQALARAQLGAEPLDIGALSSSNISEAFRQLLQGSIAANARRMSETFSPKTAVESVAQHVYARLPLEGMRCDLDPSRIARIYDNVHDLKLSYEAHLVVQSLDNSEEKVKSDFLKYKPLKYSLSHVPRFSLRQLDNQPSAKTRLAKTSRFAYEDAGGQEESSGFSLTKKAALSRIKSVAVNVVEAPVKWQSLDVKESRVAEINAAYDKLLAERA